MQVQEIMTTGITTVGRNDDLQMVTDLMAAGHLRHIPVLEDEGLVGVVSQRDVFSARMSSTMGVGEKGQRGFLHTILVKEVMRHPVTTVGPATLVSDAASIMIGQSIGCLPVVNDGDLVGILTKTDLLRCLRETDEEADNPHADS